MVRWWLYAAAPNLLLVSRRTAIQKPNAVSRWKTRKADILQVTSGERSRVMNIRSMLVS